MRGILYQLSGARRFGIVDASVADVGELLGISKVEHYACIGPPRLYRIDGGAQPDPEVGLSFEAETRASSRWIPERAADITGPDGSVLRVRWQIEKAGDHIDQPKDRRRASRTHIVDWSLMGRLHHSGDQGLDNILYENEIAGLEAVPVYRDILA